MYIEKGFLGKTDWWRYVLTFLIMLMGVLLFSFPHSLAVANLTADGLTDKTRLEDVSYLLTLFDPNINLMYMMLPFVGGLLFLLLGIKKVHQQSFVNLTTGRKKIDWKRVLFSFGTWSLVVGLSVLIQYLYEPEALVFNFQLKPFLILCVLAIILVPIQTSFEEYIFRGYLLQSLGLLAKNRLFPLIFTSVVFGVMHISNPEIAKLGYSLLIYYIATGLFLGIITLMDGGMELGLGFHAANNLISALLITADWQVFQTNSIFKDISEPNLVIAMAPSLVLLPILLVVFSKKYNWNDWKEKLSGKVIKPVQVVSDEIF